MWEYTIVRLTAWKIAILHTVSSNMCPSFLYYLLDYIPTCLREIWENNRLIKDLTLKTVFDPYIEKSPNAFILEGNPSFKVVPQMFLQLSKVI